MVTLQDEGSIVLGLVLAVLAGCLNGSWNVSFRPTHGFAVGRSHRNGNDLQYHQAWILFQVYAVLVNVPICLFWAGGPSRVAEILQASSALDIFLVIFFSLLWGIGSVGFGLACQVAGVGLGTNLCMGVIMVLGTFLPLCLDGAIATPAGGIVVAGLAVCCRGVAWAVQSLQARDLDESKPVESIDSSGHSRAQDKGDNQTSVRESSSTTTKTRSTAYKVYVCAVAGIFATQLQFAFVFGQDMIDLADELDDVPASG